MDGASWGGNALVKIRDMQDCHRSHTDQCGPAPAVTTCHDTAGWSAAAEDFGATCGCRGCWEHGWRWRRQAPCCSTCLPAARSSCTRPASSACCTGEHLANKLTIACVPMVIQCFTQKWGGPACERLCVVNSAVRTGPLTLQHQNVSMSCT